MTPARSLLWVSAAFILLASLAPSHSNPRPIASAQHSSYAEIRAVYDRWKKAFEARDLDGIMALYAPGDAVVAYDIVPPLQYRGYAAYRQDYQSFLAQYVGAIRVEYRDLRILSSGDLGVINALERITGRLKSGERSDLWLRATSVMRKIDGKWLIVHDHISLPADLATGKAVFDLKP